MLFALALAAILALNGTLLPLNVAPGPDLRGLLVGGFLLLAGALVVRQLAARRSRKRRRPRK